MGSFGGALANLAEKAVGEEGANLFRKFGTSMDMVARSHPAGAVVADYWKDFTQSRQKAFMQLEAPSKRIYDAIGKDSKLQGLINTKRDSIADIHQILKSVGHPLTSEADNLLSQRVGKGGQLLNANLTLQEHSFHNNAQANLMASATVFGPNYENLAPSFEDLLSSQNPREVALGQFLADSTSMITRDTTSFRGAPVSKTKMALNTYFEKKQKLQEKFGLGTKDYSKLSTGATYTPTSDIERGIKGFLVNRMADFAAIPHLSMLGNISSAPMQAIVKGITSLGDKDLQDLKLASGILAQSQHAIFDKQLRGANSFIGQKLGRDIGTLYYNAFHMPFFDMMRLHQISLGASVGYHSALQWGKGAVQGNKRAIEELTQMRLPVQDIIKRGGELTNEELQTAMFHYANDKFFVDKPEDSSLGANSNVFMRSATMFHRTINSQYYFMRNEMQKLIKAGDTKSIAQFAGTMLALFPAVAPFIRSATILGRTASPEKAWDDVKQSYTNLSGAGGFGNFASSYIDMLSYIGGFGIYHSYVQAAYHDRLATAAVGPLFGEGLTLGQDAINALKTNKSGDRNLRPLGRDLATLSIPVVGKWLGYKLFPTVSEERANAPKRRRGRK